MIASMTAYFQAECTLTTGEQLQLALRSVNHRFLDLHFRLPEACRHLEPALREQCKQHLSRGRVEVILQIQGAMKAGLALNQAAFKQYASLYHEMKQALPELAVSFASLLDREGVIEAPPSSLDDQEILAQVGSGLVSFVELRQREGQSLHHYFIERLEKMRAMVAQLQAKSGTFVALQRARIEEQLAGIAVDQGRFEQELVYWAQRADVAEELSRLLVHINEVARLLEQGGVVGRRLDFLMQELNREANTLGSKSQDGEVSKIVVSLKVLIEQMREQIQNIE